MVLTPDAALHAWSWIEVGRGGAGVRRNTIVSGAMQSTWRERGRNAITLTKEPGLGLVLMVLGKGTKISEHQAAGPLTLHVLSGSVTFRTRDRADTLGAGELIVLEAAIDHEVEALQESVVLLTLAGAA